MTTLSIHAGFNANPERESRIAMLLDMIERRAPYLMNCGGGGLTRPCKKYERVTRADSQRMETLFKADHSVADICQITGFSHATVWRYTRALREKARK